MTGLGHPVLGAHVSAAGGVSRSLERAEQIRCQSVQLFAKNNKCWVEGPIAPDEISRFRKLAVKFDRVNLMSHAGYLINVAATDTGIYRRSLQSLCDEIRRAESLGLCWVVLHPGSHGGRGDSWGIDRAVKCIQTALDRTRNCRAGILLETTAGQGNALGWKFEHIRDIGRRLKPARRIGACVDTCHIFAAGYEIRTRAGYETTMTALDRIIGIRRVRAFHLNDSLREFGSRVDRHQHIGRGEIGLDAFRFLMNDPRFAGVPMVLETPKQADMKEDVMNLATLRRLIRRRGRRTAA